LWVVLGLEITNNGILLTTDYQGRASGEAFVQFVSDEHTEKALEKNKQSMGHRWVWSGSGGWFPPLALARLFFFKPLKAKVKRNV
jgi:hypothetical protein